MSKTMTALREYAGLAEFNERPDVCRCGIAGVDDPVCMDFGDLSAAYLGALKPGRLDQASSVIAIGVGEDRSTAWHVERLGRLSVREHLS